MAFDPTKTEQKDDFKQEPMPDLMPKVEAIVDTPNGKMLQFGDFASPNFKKSSSGWILRSDGSVEFGDGIFRGKITASSITTNQQEITVETDESIADAITELGASGGMIRLKAGTYVCTDDINIPSNVTLVGQGMGVTILYFATLNKGIKAQGSSNYSTGTVTISNGGQVVTGLGTSWLANVTTNHKIRLDNYWYDIYSVDSDTQITLTSKYIGSDVTGSTYDSAIMVEHFFLQHLTVYGSGGNGIYINYGYYFFLDNVASVSNGGDGVSINNSTSFVNEYINAFDNGSDGIYYNQVDHLSGDVLWCLRNTAKGINGTKIFDSKFNSPLCRNNEGGVYLDTFNDSVMNAADISNNTNIGLELNASGPSFLLSNEFQNNGSDGVKLTADCDVIIVTGCAMDDNGGYGLNIAAASDNNNMVNGNHFNNNSSGNCNNAGTGTIFGINDGIISSIDWETRTYTAGESISGASGSIPIFYNASLITNTTTHLTINATGSSSTFGKDDASRNSIGQTFQEAGAMDNVNTIKVYLSKSGTPTDNVRVSIRATSGGLPTGGDLAYADVAGADLTTSLVLKTLTLNTAVNLSAGTKYAIVFTRSGSLDNSNYYNTQIQSSSIYANGNLVRAIGTNWFSEAEDIYLVLQYVETYTADRVYISDANNTDRHFFLGFATTTANAGQNITVKIGGVSNGFTGLTPNSTYYVQDTIGTIGTSPGSTSLPVGKALSTSEILL